MAKSTLYHYTVTGTGYFPIDMLRRDACYPADDTAVRNMMDQPDHHENRKDFYSVPRKVKLSSSRKPTTARWESFGWDVGTVTQTDY